MPEHRNQSEEKCSTLVAYSKEECRTEEDLANRAEGLQLHRKDRLKVLRKRILGIAQGRPMPQGAPEQESAQNSQNVLSPEDGSADGSAKQAAAAASDDGRRGDEVSVGKD